MVLFFGVGFLSVVLLVLTISAKPEEIRGKAAPLGFRDRRAADRCRRGLCRACGYDLKGLSEGARCPECGETEPLTAPRTPAVRYAIDRAVLAKIALVFAVALILLPTYAFIIGIAHVESYVAQGYSREVAVNAARVRDFEIAEWLWLSNPMFLSILVSPFLALISRRRTFARVFVLFMGGAGLLGLAWVLGSIRIVCGR